MKTPSPQELDAFEKQCDAWFAENTVRDRLHVAADLYGSVDGSAV
jgi:hypothetical protein